MLAMLRAILGERCKAAWLVPQRSLTDELDRELENWRGTGLRIERLSGEYHTDIEKVRAADLLGRHDGEVRGHLPGKLTAGRAQRGRLPGR